MDQSSNDSRNSSASARGAGRSGDAQEELRRAAGNVKDKVAAGARDLREEVMDMAEPLQQRARDYAEDRKAAGAEQLAGVARAIESAAAQLEQQLPQVSGYIRDAAQKVEKLSGAVRDKSLEYLLHETNRYARTNTAMFFGLSVAAGFALARFLRSGAPTAPADASSTHVASPPLQPHPGQADLRARDAQARHAAFPNSTSEF